MDAGGVGRVAVAAALLVALLPAVAAARVVRAETVMPPGNSGFVSTPGLADGSGSPHLTDQIELYTSFRYKPAGFDLEGDASEPKPGVRIARDAYGVPAITAAAEQDAWWGAGYAAAEDRLFQLELFKRAGRGRLAEILGSDYLDDDLAYRRDFYTSEEVMAQFDKLPVDLRTRVESYRDGINAYIAEVRSRPDLLPGEFTALGVQLQDWTVEDTLRIGIILARQIPSGDGLELDNARALRDIGARNFNRLLPVQTRNRGHVTVPRSEGLFPSQPGRTRRDRRIGFRRSRRFLSRLELPPVEDPAAASVSAKRRGPAILGDRRGSMMWAIRGREGAAESAFVANGPQLGYLIPEMLYEFEIHAPGLNARGVTAAGVPIVGIGRNEHVAWGFTSGLTDDDDLYVEELTGDETYRFRGEERSMECRDETFTWRAPPTGVTDPLGLLTGGAPAGSRTERVCRTLHGPVQERHGGRAYARRYAIWGREVETLIGLDLLNRARTIEDVDRALAQVTWNENVMAVDDQGHMGYWHPGLLPLKPRRWDERLPFPGTGEAEWRGFLPVRRRPHVIDPKRGWLVNWNNLPSARWTNGDAPDRDRLSGPLHRMRVMEPATRRAARDPSYEAHIGIDRILGSTAQAQPFVKRKLRAARRRLTEPVAIAALDALIAWNGDYTVTDANGTTDPGYAVWKQLKCRAGERATVTVMGESARLLTGAGEDCGGHEVNAGEAYAFLRARPREIAKAASIAGADLAQQFGTPDVARWREPREMVSFEAQGAGQAPDMPLFSRGTWIQSVSLGP